MAVARAKGRLRGKQPKLSPRQEAHLVELYHAGAHTIGELEELFPVTRSTIYRAVARAAAPPLTVPPRHGLPGPGMNSTRIGCCLYFHSRKDAAWRCS